MRRVCGEVVLEPGWGTRTVVQEQRGVARDSADLARTFAPPLATSHRLQPSNFDPLAATSAPGDEDLARLRDTWNAWNGKARKLLDQVSAVPGVQRDSPTSPPRPLTSFPHSSVPSRSQGSRIENLWWRRWHMDRRHGLVQHASPSLNSPHPDLYGLHASVEAHERRKATEDLETFLRTTLQQAQVRRARAFSLEQS